MTDSEPIPSISRTSFTGFLRDTRFIKFISQAIFLVLLLSVIAWLVGNLLEALDTRGLNLSFDFFSRTAGFNIGEGIPMERTDSFWRAYIVGLVNTVRVILVGLLLATILGIFAGIALLSQNFLLRSLVNGYVEIIRNTPLLVQLFFIYFAVILTLPSIQERIEVGPFMLSQRGFYFPKPIAQESFTIWLAVFLLSLFISAVLYWALLRRRIQEGIETRPSLWAAIVLIVPPLLVWLFVPGNPLTLENPTFDGVQQISGARLTPEFAAILLGLVLYTAAFIADIVRAGIQAVPKGQDEAATAVGLTKGQVLRLVILPQALRVIIPPLTNQYLNLAKNSSLAVGVGFPDLYNISSTIFNQSGQAVQVISLMMGTYLALSLIISAIMNFLNDRLKIPERV
jgi:general L-amino acid transport system permease protein